MKLYSENENYKLYHGNMLDILEVIEPNTIDSIVTDPPYELNFMSKGWDNAGVSFQKETWQKCYEVLKPGGYLLAFGGSRTFHRIACAIEDAGFEIRDTIMWIYGSGFPKSMNLGKALDRKNGIDNIQHKGKWNFEHGNMEEFWKRKKDYKKEKEKPLETDLAKQWQGWGTALKPSFEPIIVARKPFKGSLVDNVIENGVGGINIDECRVGNTNADTYDLEKRQLSKATGSDDDGHFLDQLHNQDAKHGVTEQGRFPANTILTYDETDFDEVCGGFPDTKNGGQNETSHRETWFRQETTPTRFAGDSGNASRYFMNCKYTGKDKEIWKQLLVSNVENNLEILKATKDSFAQISVEDLLKELKNHYAKYVETQSGLIETHIAQDIVEILTWDFKIGTSKVIQGFIGNYKKCIQFLNLVQFVEEMDNIDTTQTTQNLLKLFGYVKAVITNYIQGNIEFDQRRYIYTPKASKRDRDEGLDEFKESKVNDGRQTPIDNAFQRGETPRRNVHPTVKPTSLMQYLVRLVTPNGGTILDPFNGSGSTGKAVMYENHDRNKNYKYIGIELTEEYLPIARARIEYVCNLKEEKQTTIDDFIGKLNE